MLRRFGHGIEHPPGPVIATTRTGKGGKIVDSPITIIGAAPPAPAPALPPAPDVVTLELAVSRGDAGYNATAHVRRPDSQADVSSPHQPLALDEDALRAHWPDAEALNAALFAGSPLRDALLQTLAAAQALRAPLRLQLHLDQGTPELHGLCWEALRHPLTNAPLLTSQQVWCSRYLGSADWSPVDLSRADTLRPWRNCCAR